MKLYLRLTTGSGEVLSRLSFSVFVLLGLATECQPGQVDEDQMPFPLVVRISESSFASSEPEVEERTKVDLYTFGIRNRGTATVVGQLAPNFVTEPDNARLELVFAGTSIAHTVGCKGPAVIRSTSNSQFHLVAPVSFDLEQGFFTGDVTGDVRVTSISHQVEATVPGLRGRLVRRVAYKQLRKKGSQLRATAEENSRRRLTQSMDKRMNERLQELNRRWFQIRRTLRQQPWYEQAPHLYVATTETHLLIFVAPGGEKPKPDYTGLSSYPLPAPNAESKAELLVHTDLLDLGEKGKKIVELLEQAEAPFAVIFGDDATATVEAEAADPWSVFELDFAATQTGLTTGRR